MCGIYAVWNRNGARVDIEALRRSVGLLRHRGPDDEGYLFIDSRSGECIPCAGDDTVPGASLPHLDSLGDSHFDLALGFRRLSILDVTAAGHQPMGSRDGRYWIVFNGEIYNYLELREELVALGHEFVTATDTEVIVASYRAWGPACLSRFNGMWALCLWDRDARVLFLARDRFGVKPLYYNLASDRMVVASEIKALVGQHGLPFRPEQEEVYRYLVLGALPSPRAGDTFFTGVKSLPPGTSQMVSRRDHHRDSYWHLSLPAADSMAGSPRDEAVERYGLLFRDAVRLRLRSDVPLGSCLSGGVDSSSIVCSIKQLVSESGSSGDEREGRQQTFSAIYDIPGVHDERDHIRTVVDATGVESHFAFPDAAGLNRQLEALVWHQEEPFPSTSMYAQWCVMQLARDCGVTVLLDGQGADESLGGYRPFAQFLRDMIRRGALAQTVPFVRAVHARTGISPWRLLRDSLLLQLPESAHRFLRPRLKVTPARNVGISRAFDADAGTSATAEWQSRWTGHRSLDEHLRQLVEEWSLPHLLRYADRSSMAFSVEARMPFVDYRLVETAFQEAGPWRIYDGWTKWVLRSAMDGIVPPANAWRRDKVGFETPEGTWIRDLTRVRPDLFDDTAHSHEYLDLCTVRSSIDSWNAEMPGAVDLQSRIWRWITFELWLRVWSRA